MFEDLTDRRLRRGAFSSLPALVDAIELWVEHWNDDPKPFVWHAEADKILEKVRRGPRCTHRSQIRDAGLTGGGQDLPPAPPKADANPAVRDFRSSRRRPTVRRLLAP